MLSIARCPPATWGSARPPILVSGSGINLHDAGQSDTLTLRAADAYYADLFETDGDRYVAIITDTRDDAPLERHHVELGTRILVPNTKLKVDSGLRVTASSS